MILSEKNYPAFLILLWLTVHLVLLNHFGVRQLFDSVDYIKEADHFLKFGKFDDTHHVYYAIPVLTIAFFRFLFPEEIFPFLIFQSVIACVAMLALYASGSKVFRSKKAGLISGVIFLLWWDNIHWNITVMTESLAGSVCCFLIYFLVSFQNRFKDYSLITFALAICFFIRPTGILFIVATILFLIQFHWSYLRAKPALLFFVFASILLVMVAGADWMFQRWDFTDQLKRGNIVTYADVAKEGDHQMMPLRLDASDMKLPDDSTQPLYKMMRFAFDNPVYFAKSASLKVFYLLSFVRPYYSSLHNFISLVWVGLLYVLYFIGFKKTSVPIKFFSLAIIILNCALIGISTVDWDNRFFIPMEPGLVLIAGGGAAALISHVQSLKRKN